MPKFKSKQLILHFLYFNKKGVIPFVNLFADHKAQINNELT